MTGDVDFVFLRDLPSPFSFLKSTNSFNYKVMRPGSTCKGIEEVREGKEAGRVSHHLCEPNPYRELWVSV